MLYGLLLLSTLAVCVLCAPQIKSLVSFGWNWFWSIPAIDKFLRKVGIRS